MALVAVSVPFFAVTALLGPSGAEPDLLGAGWTRHLTAHPADWVVTALLWTAMVSATGGVALGWWALRRGWAPELRLVRRWSFLGAAVMALLPPLGSSDVLSYGAYGRMVVLGLNPYTTTVTDLVVAGDPVGVGYQGAWSDVSSVYGPAALGIQGAVSWLSGTSMQTFAALMQLLALVAFVATALLLDRAAGDHVARARVAVLWTANPVLWYLVVNSAHIDGLAVALGVAGLLVVNRSPAMAGVLAGLAVGVKISYVLYAVALVWAVRHARRSLLRLALAGAATGAVLFVPFLPEIFGPLRTASEYVAQQSLWAIVHAPLERVWSPHTVARGLGVAVWVLTAFLVWRLAKILPQRSAHPTPRDEAVRAAAMLSVGWLLSATYALPWYDVIAWAPLVLIPASGVDLVVLVRMASVAIGYLPGLVIRPPGAVGAVTAALRGQVAPTIGLALVVCVLFFGDRLRLRPPAERRPQASSLSQ